MTRGISDNLHLKLTGDFDGSSAYEPINLLKNYGGIVRRIFIHTCFFFSLFSWSGCIPKK